ncbi:hypothetical protein [Photobacterium sanguinicancri]|uniref:hypothetical protein n=1 Tax=Photobacterium sanguinicancri TaxID=875932 RepID=UPI0007899A03|nr:hypothetical protein [Photobacterium sanguinicancri]KXI21747.1 hypothetical protein AS132_19095 [Photobacterium sanguinicancri]
MPHKIFTGYNFDFKHTIENGDDYFRLKLCKSNFNGPAGLKNYLSRDNNFGFNIPNSEKKYAIENNINIARKNPNVIIDCKIENKPLRDLFDMDNDSDSRAIQAGIENYNCYANRTLLDIVVGSFLFDLGPSFNLLGDSLVKPVRQPIVVELYRGGVSLDTYNEEKDLLEKQFELFRERIDQSDDGWVDVIPFNENLVFLKGVMGSMILYLRTSEIKFLITRSLVRH